MDIKKDKKKLRKLEEIKKICEECGRSKKIPPIYCISCKQEMNKCL